MNRIKQIATAALLGASIGLSGCAAGLPAKVTRYSALPIPQGQSFYVVPGQGRAATGGLEYQRFAGLVAQQLGARGYVPAASPQSATMLVQLGYDVDQGTERQVADGGYGGFGRGFGYGGGFGGYGGYGGGYGGGMYDPRFGIYYGRPYYSSYGYYGARSPFYYGWDDPSWFGGGQIREYTEYKSKLTLDIRDRLTNRPLFDGRAEARSTTDELGTLVPNLVEAMFTGFPGRNGETVKITVPARRTR